MILDYGKVDGIKHDLRDFIPPPSKLMMESRGFSVMRDGYHTGICVSCRESIIQGNYDCGAWQWALRVLDWYELYSNNGDLRDTERLMQTW